MLKKILLLTTLLGLVNTAMGQHPGELDLAFNTNNAQFPCNIGANESISAIVKLPNNQFLIGGSFTVYNGISVKKIARINADGSLDTSFAPIGADAGDINALAVQPDGKIIVAGSMTNYGGLSCKRIVRILPNGTLDSSFNTLTGFDNGSVLSLGFLSNGKIVATGSFNQYNGAICNYLTRLNTDGTLDTSFTTSGGLGGAGACIAVQSDDKIIVGGNFSTYRSQSAQYLVRINTDGTRDTSFIDPTAFNLFVRSLYINTAGKILVSGNFTSFNSTNVGGIVLLNPDGTRDTTFATGTGFTTGGGAFAITQQSNGCYLLAGYFTGYGGSPRKKIVRLLPNGALDTSFTTTATSETLTGITLYGIALDANEQCIAIGSFTTFNDITRNHIMKLTSTGTLDLTFNPAVGSSGSIRPVLLPDGKMIFAGGLARYGTANVGRITRVFPNGERDTSFTIPGVTSTGSISTAILHPNGTIFIGGSFSEFNGVSLNSIAQITTDGAIVSGFSIGTGFNGTVRKIAVQSDGKLIAIGDFTSYNGVTCNRIARLLVNGSLDTSFLGNVATGALQDILVQPDDKILIAGNIPNGCRRLNANGSADATFNANGLSSVNIFTVYSLGLQSDGKIIVGGSLEFPNLNDPSLLLRLLPNGNYDGSFTAPFKKGDTNYDLQKVVVQPDDKLLVSGSFYDLNGIVRNHFCRLNANGSVDQNFDVGSGLSPVTGSSSFYVNEMLLLPNDRILLCGPFWGYNGIRRDYVARIYGACALAQPTAVGQSFCGTATIDDLSATGTGLAWYTSASGGTALTNSTPLVSGTYYVSQSDTYCTSSRTAVTVTINPTDAPQGASNQDLSVMNSNEATIADLVVTGTALQWYASLNDLANGISLPTDTVVTDGSTYYVTQTVNGCQSEPLAVTVTVTLGTPNFSSMGYALTPNPSRSTVLIQGNQTIDKVTMFSLLGQKVAEQSANSNQTVLDISSLPAGVYGISITSGASVSSYKIVKAE